jgi:hypothetical protein
MRFPRPLYLLLLIPLALALICSEIPESRALADDVSNDLVIASLTPAKSLASAPAASVFSLVPPPHPLISNDQLLVASDPAPLSAEKLLHLLSIQRK